MSEAEATFQGNCPQCGAKVDADARFCKHCAFDLSQVTPHSDATVATPVKDHRHGNSKRIVFVGGIAIVGLLLLGIIGTYIYKRNRAQAAVATSSPTPVSPTMSDRAKQIESKILRGENLSDSDIAGLSAYELRVLRNVHFARYGRKYDQTGDLGSYFYTRPWYKPNDSYNDNMITAADKANINLILVAEKTVSNSEGVSTNNNTTIVNSSPPVSTPHPTNELSRETVMSLVSNRKDAITMSFIKSQHETYGSENYERLINDRAIICKKFLVKGDRFSPDKYMYQECVPGQNGREFTMDSASLNLVIGYKVASQVTGISKVDATTAMADILMTFERASGYRLYEKYQFMFGNSPPPHLQNESRRALLRLYDDGWRIEQFN